MRAFDAAVYLTGKEPYYFVYPENYFPSRSPKPSKEEVQTQAKLFAEKTDDVKEDTDSFLANYSKTGSGESPQESKTPSDVKPVEKMETADPSKLQELDEYLQKGDPTELQLLTELPLSALEWSSDWAGFNPPVEEEKVVMDEMAAYRKGLSIQMELRELLKPDLCLPSPFEFESIEDDFFPNSEEMPLKASSKRKRDGTEGAVVVRDGRKSVGFAETAVFPEGASYDDWLRTLILNEPTELNDPLNPRQPAPEFLFGWSIDEVFVTVIRTGASGFFGALTIPDDPVTAWRLVGKALVDEVYNI